MKLQKTIKIKIGKLSKNKQNILNRLINKNTKAINFCLQKSKTQMITHKLVYKDLRKLNLPSTIVHGCRAKSIEIIKSFYKRKGKKSFPELKNSVVRYDNVSVKLRKTNNILYKYFISLLYKGTKLGMINNRTELPLIINSDYQTEIIKKIGENYKLGSTELVKKNNDFYIHISYSKEIEIPNPDKSFSPIGIDIGINNLAVSVSQQETKFFSGRRVKWKNEFFRKQRNKLQRNFAIKEIRRMKKQQTKYNNHYINEISKSIIEQAKKENKPVIVMEDLKDILQTIKVRKKQRAIHHSWFFDRLQKAIEYKALWEEIPVIKLDPYHTSQICNKCGELNKRNKHTYKCKKCGYEVNADFNACINLKQLFFAKCKEERVIINLTPNRIMPEPKLSKDNSVGNITRGDSQSLR